MDQKMPKLLTFKEVGMKEIEEKIDPKYWKFCIQQ